MLEARDAAGLLWDREVLKLLAVIVLGWWMIETGSAATAWVASPGFLDALSTGIGSLTVLSGYVLYYGGVLALLVKLVYEAVLLAERQPER